MRTGLPMRERGIYLSAGSGEGYPTVKPEPVITLAPAATLEPSATDELAPTWQPVVTEEPATVTQPPAAQGQPVETVGAEAPGDTEPVEPRFGGPLLWLSLGVVAAALAVSAAVLALRRKKKRRPAPMPPVKRADDGAWGCELRVGKVHELGARESQQDCFAVSPEELAEEQGLLAVVADGMGGLKDGDKVSQEAVSAMLSGFCSAKGEPRAVLLELLGRANLSVNRLLGRDGLTKSGSTLAAALIRDGEFHWLSVGDSRISMYRDGELIQLNREHIYRNELFIAAVNGEEDLETAAMHPKGGGLTSYLGMGRLRYVDIPAAPVRVKPGDRFVLMSDGVYNAIGPDELASALELDAESAALKIDSLVAAKGHSAQDNYTAIVIEAGSGGRRNIG